MKKYEMFFPPADPPQTTSPLPHHTALLHNLVSPFEVVVDAVDVSLDFLVGNAEINKVSLNQLNKVNKMNPEDKNLVWSFLDAFILKTKLQGVMK